jgi:hypothetical protein
MTAQLTDQQLAAAIECAIGLTQDCGGTAGVHAVRDAVLAVVQPELDRLRAERDELLAELDGRDEKARKRWIKNQEKQLGIRYTDFRDGKWEMDLAMGREMAAAYVAMARTMLGDGPNYSETRLEFDVKIAESPEVYTLVVQRHAPGALTPHEARQRAETERDQALAEAEQLRAQLAGLWPCTCGHLPGQHRYDAAIGRNFCRSCPADADLHEYAAAGSAPTTTP